MKDELWRWTFWCVQTFWKEGSRANFIPSFFRRKLRLREFKWLPKDLLIVNREHESRTWSINPYPCIPIQPGPCLSHCAPWAALTGSSLLLPIASVAPTVGSVSLILVTFCSSQTLTFPEQPPSLGLVGWAGRVVSLQKPCFLPQWDLKLNGT